MRGGADAPRWPSQPAGSPTAHAPGGRALTDAAGGHRLRGGNPRARAPRRSGRRRVRAPGEWRPSGWARGLTSAGWPAGAAHARSRRRWRRGRPGGGGGAAAGAVTGLGWVGDATHSPRCGSRREPPRPLEAAPLVVPSRRCRTPRRGREEAGAAASHTVRARGRGGSGARGAWGWGAAARGEAGGSRSQVLTRGGVFFLELGRRPPCLRGPPGRLGLPAGQGRDWGAPRGRWPVRRAGLGPFPAAEPAGKPETPRRRGCCLGPARPCDPLYSCHNLGTFGAAPNGAPARPAPPEEPPPSRPHPEAPGPARRGPSGRCRRPWAGSVSGRGSGLGPWGAGLRAPGWSDCTGSRAPRRRGVFLPGPRRASPLLPPAPPALGPPVRGSQLVRRSVGSRPGLVGSDPGQAGPRTRQVSAGRGGSWDSGAASGDGQAF